MSGTRLKCRQPGEITMRKLCDGSRFSSHSLNTLPAADTLCESLLRRPFFCSSYTETFLWRVQRPFFRKVLNFFVKTSLFEHIKTPYGYSTRRSCTFCNFFSTDPYLEILFVFFRKKNAIHDPFNSFHCFSEK